MILNDFLQQSLNDDGSLKDQALTDANVAKKDYVDDAVANITIDDASESEKGIIQLANDLSGTATAPVARASSLKTTTTDVAIGAAAAPAAGQFLRASDGSNANWQAMPRSFGWYLNGLVVVGDGQGPYYTVDADVTILGFDMSCKVAPTTIDNSFDVETADNPAGPWSSIFSSRPSIVVGANVGTGGAISTTTLNAGEYLRFNVKTADSNSAQGVTAQLRMETR